MPYLPSVPAAPSGPPVRSRLSAMAGSITAEAIFGLVTILALTSLAIVGWSVGMDALKKRAVAQQLQQVGEAAVVYARAQGLLSDTTLNTAVKTVTTDDLVASGALPPLPSGGTLKNAWGQEYVIYYYIPASPSPSPTSSPARRLVCVVLTTGGEAMDELALSAVAMAGTGGGVVVNKATPTAPDWALRGVGNSYELPLDESTDPKIPSPGQGHIGLYVSLDEAALGTDALYRYEVPGNPELNQMHVDLDMARHSLREVKELQFSATEAATVDLTKVCGTTNDEKNAAEGKVFFYTGGSAGQNGLYACRSGEPYLIGDAGNSRLVRSVATVTPGATITKPTCPDGEAPFISVSPAVIPATATGTVRTFYADASNTWTVHMQVVGGDGSDLIGGSISVITSCSPIP